MAWVLDASHSSITFAVRHMMISKVRGSFSGFAVDASFDAGALEKGSVIGTIDVGTIATGDAGRDGHLKGDDFFAVEKFPQMTFKSTGAKKLGDGRYTLEGTLTIKGVSKPISFDVEAEGPAKDPWGNSRVGFTLKGKLNREDFGLTWNQALETGGVLVSKDVELGAEIQLIQK
jgi:polyisoprenoid-binding protein YceI